VGWGEKKKAKSQVRVQTATPALPCLFENVKRSEQPWRIGGGKTNRKRAKTDKGKRNFGEAHHGVVDIYEELRGTTAGP